MTILIVEDNRHMRRMLAEMMRTAFESATVLEAADAASALALCRAARPACVLMDVGLPDSSGIDLTAEIRTLLPDAKVVIVSNHRDRASRDAAFSAGAAAYVFKDEVYEKLLATLSDVLAAPNGNARPEVEP